MSATDENIAKKAKTEDATEEVAATTETVAETVAETPTTETTTTPATTTTAAAASEPVEVDADVARRILAQVEFYFGDANFANDKFLRAEAEKPGADGFVPIATLLTFNRLRQLSDNAAVIAQCVAESDVVELSADRLSVKRRKSEVPTDSVARSIVTSVYPDDVTWEQVAEFWNTKVGNVGATRLHRRKGDKTFTGTVFIEFNTAEAADAAVAAAADGTLKFRDSDETFLQVQSKETYIAEQREKRKAAAAEAKASKAAAAGEAAAADGAAAAAAAGPREVRYTKGCIVIVAGLGVIPGRDDLKAALEPFGDVEYVDYGDEDVEGKVRFADPDAAQAALDAFAAGTREIFGKVPSLSLLEGDDELAYWTAIVASSDAKKARRGNAGGRRGGRRGRGGGKRRR